MSTTTTTIRTRQSSAPSAMSTTNTNTTECSLNFNQRCAKQPLYRPAALRRNDSLSTEHHLMLFHSPSPPLSPAPSSTDLRGSWLAGLAAAAVSTTTKPWSSNDSSYASESTIRGTMISRKSWKPDEEAIECADLDCSLKFGLIDRKHHCRRCGQVFCGAHSSRTAALWPSPDDVASVSRPGSSSTRSSTLDLPSLLPSYFASALSTTPTSPSTTPTPSNMNGSGARSPPRSLPPPAQTVQARVCDQCYFSSNPYNINPITGALTPPPSSYGTHFAPISSGSRPVSFRPSSSSTGASPAQSPPDHYHHHQQQQIPFNMNTRSTSRGASKSRSRTRSRQGSGTSSSLSSNSNSNSTSPSTSTAASSVLVLGGGSADGGLSAGIARQRGLSPAASLRLALSRGCCVEEEGEGQGGLSSDEEEQQQEEDEEEEEEALELGGGTGGRRAATVPLGGRDRDVRDGSRPSQQQQKFDTTFGSMGGQWGWQNWATF
ncbi:hypothetical protein T439DRAFT_378314 [Meredithblackwellia eburnea MCA 4105]